METLYRESISVNLSFFNAAPFLTWLSKVQILWWADRRWFRLPKYHSWHYRCCPWVLMEAYRRDCLRCSTCAVEANLLESQIRNLRTCKAHFYGKCWQVWCLDAWSQQCGYRSILRWVAWVSILTQNRALFCVVWWNPKGLLHKVQWWGRYYFLWHRRHRDGECVAFLQVLWELWLKVVATSDWWGPVV